MITRTKLFALAGLCVCLVGAGCTTPMKTVPTGRWAGTGTYVDYEAKTAAAGKVESEFKSASYTTTLDIKQGELYGRRVLFFDIRSERGRLMNVEGEESHVTFTLAEVNNLPDGPTLYALVQFDFNPLLSSHTSEEDLKELVQMASATAVRHGAAIVLDVLYIGPTKAESNCFWDTFVFEGDQVCKTGRVLQIKEQDKGARLPSELKWVDWCELLRRTK